jgi:NitT/TauT family transport system substrate-binding protein
VTIDWYVYNAGPSAMEAFFTESLDLAYVGPGPAINAYLRSHGEEVRIIAGAADGGAALVVGAASSITSANDFRGKRMATPQLGNTQDIAARAWLRAAGLKVTQTGGDVLVVPTANPDQLDLFVSGQVDGVWTVEPWVSRLLRDAQGRVLVEQRDPVTVLTARAAFAAAQPGLLNRFRIAARELTRWIVEHPDEAKDLVAAELGELTRRPFDRALLDAAWPRITVTDAIAPEALERVREQLRASGFLREDAPLAGLLALESR